MPQKNNFLIRLQIFSRRICNTHKTHSQIPACVITNNLIILQLFLRHKLFHSFNPTKYGRNFPANLAYPVPKRRFAAKNSLNGGKRSLAVSSHPGDRRQPIRKRDEPTVRLLA
jgi:hypothetical protein